MRNSGASFCGPAYRMRTSGRWPGSPGAITLGFAEVRRTFGGTVSTSSSLRELMILPSLRRTTRMR